MPFDRSTCFSVLAMVGGITISSCTDKDNDPAGMSSGTAEASSDGEDSGDGGSQGSQSSGNPTTVDPSASTDGSSAAATDGGEVDDGAPTGSEDESGSFLIEPDGGVAEQCIPGLQDCPEGQKCTPYLMQEGGCCVDATHCVPDDGGRQFGDTCTRAANTDDCAKGLFCMTSTSGALGEGVCLELCDPDVGTCEHGGSCFSFNDGILPLCEQECHPLLQDCQNTQNCYAAFDRFICAKPGFANGEGLDGSACEAIQSCETGLVCVLSTSTAGCMDTRCCTPFCDLMGDDSQCAEPMEDCVPWYEMGMAPPGLDDVGACTIPM